MASISSREGCFPQIRPSLRQIQPPASQVQETLPKIQGMLLKAGGRVLEFASMTPNVQGTHLDEFGKQGR